MAQSSNVVPLRGRKGAAPNALNGKVPPPRRKNKDVRSREHLTPDEVEALMTSARSLGRYGHRDATLILMAFRHGLRVSTRGLALGYGGPQAGPNACQQAKEWR